MSENGPRSGRAGQGGKGGGKKAQARDNPARDAPVRDPPAREDYARTTRGVTVTVRAFFLADQSSPDDNRFVWGYRVRIANLGPETVRLLRRTWQITDARGRTQHVHGPGVVGETPLLKPGEAFEYASGTPLDTPSGFMTGAYHMEVPDSGEAFDVAIPAFSLDSPHQGGGIH